MPVSAEQWRVAIGSFTSVRLVKQPYTHGIHSQYLLKYLILCVFYAYTRMYMYMFVQYIIFLCMIKLFFFSVSVNNLVFFNINCFDSMLLHNIAKCSQYIVILIFFMYSLHLLHVLYSALFKSLLCMVLPGRICYGYMHIKKSINVYCQHTMMLSCFFHSCLSLQLLLLCGDVETNPGPTTKICPECSASVNVKILMCSCGYFFKTNKINIICPQCSSVIHKKKAQCACGYVLKHKEDNSVMQTKRGMETDAHTIERRAKSRKLMAERRASESEAVTMARRQSNRIAMAGKRVSESDENLAELLWQLRDHLSQPLIMQLKIFT